MSRILGVLYGTMAYVLFLVAFLYAIGFVGNFIVPKSIDTGSTSAMLEALIVNVLLLGLFAIQHSVMARPGFKRWWTRIVPPVVERSTYVLISSSLLLLLFWQWRPMTETIWFVSDPVGRSVLIGLFCAGWLIVLLATFMISHFELFGLRQVLLNLRGKTPAKPQFMVRGFYRIVRHPIMLGFIIAFWATPSMTLGHLVFAIATTAYILIALQLEERDLIDMLGDAYRNYRRHVPMLIPWSKTRRAEERRAGVH